MSAWIVGVSVAAALGAGAAWVNWVTDSNRRLRDEIRKVPVTQPEAVESGSVVRLTGIVEVTAQLSAPISGRACAIWHVVVHRLDAHTRPQWRVQVDESRTSAFLLRMGDVVAHVDPKGACLLIHPDQKTQSGVTEAHTERVAAFFAEHGVHDRGEQLAFNAAYRINEGVLEDAERATVVGVASWANVEGGRELRIGAMEDGRLLVSDEEVLVEP